MYKFYILAPVIHLAAAKKLKATNKLQVAVILFLHSYKNTNVIQTAYFPTLYYYCRTLNVAAPTSEVCANAMILQCKKLKNMELE